MRLGRGSAFSFLLRLKAPPPSAPDEAGPSPRAPLQGLRVLVADDNDVNVFVITGFLRKWGAEADVVVNGQDAVERVKERDYDVVLMDLHMPGGTARRHARDPVPPRPAGAALPIIAVSASMRMAEPNEIDAAGFTEFVGKPVNPDVLFTKISRYLAPAP